MGLFVDTRGEQHCKCCPMTPAFEALKERTSLVSESVQRGSVAMWILIILYAVRVDLVV